MNLSIEDLRGRSPRYQRCLVSVLRNNVLLGDDFMDQVSGDVTNSLLVEETTTERVTSLVVGLALATALVYLALFAPSLVQLLGRRARVYAAVASIPRNVVIKAKTRTEHLCSLDRSTRDGPGAEPASPSSAKHSTPHAKPSPSFSYVHLVPLVAALLLINVGSLAWIGSIQIGASAELFLRQVEIVNAEQRVTHGAQIFTRAVEAYRADPLLWSPGELAAISREALPRSIAEASLHHFSLVYGGDKSQGPRASRSDLLRGYLGRKSYESEIRRSGTSLGPCSSDDEVQCGNELEMAVRFFSAGNSVIRTLMAANVSNGTATLDPDFALLKNIWTGRLKGGWTTSANWFNTRDRQYLSEVLADILLILAGNYLLSTVLFAVFLFPMITKIKDETLTLLQLIACLPSSVLFESAALRSLCAEYEGSRETSAELGAGRWELFKEWISLAGKPMLLADLEGIFSSYYSFELEMKTEKKNNKK